MTTYKTLYHLMVHSMSEAIDLYDEGKGILAREVLKKALLDAEDQVISHDIISDEPISNDYSSADPAKV
jgi:sulfur relay (sulfurtransferase) DsrF/TusC family protein